MTTFDIPKQHRAAVREGKGHDAKAPVKEIPVDMPGPSEILVKINWYVLLVSLAGSDCGQDWSLCFRQVAHSR